MTELERIIADMRTDGAADTLYSPERLGYYADRLAALAGAAPVGDLAALVSAGEKVGAWLSAAIDDPVVCVEMKRDADRFLHTLDPFLGGLFATLHAPAKAREEHAFAMGWRAAANWMERDDLIADIGSPAYTKDRDAALATFAEGD